MDAIRLKCHCHCCDCCCFIGEFERERERSHVKFLDLSRRATLKYTAFGIMMPENCSIHSPNICVRVYGRMRDKIEKTTNGNSRTARTLVMSVCAYTFVLRLLL